MRLIGFQQDNQKTRHEKGWRMKNLGTLLLIGGLVCWGAYLAPARAGDWDQKTVLTFSRPVEVPGIVLPAGTYVFSFLGSTADRNLIEVLSRDEQKVYATIEAIPDYRADATGGTSIVFEERKAGAPHAIKEWFFPDHRYGHEFVYPDMGVLELGKSDESKAMIGYSGQTMQPETTDYLRVLHLKQTGSPEPVGAEESATRPIESGGMSYLQVLHRKQFEMMRQEQAPVQSAMLRELPRTSSYLPLVGLSGILLLATGIGLRLYLRRVD
jgi:hypothetical protein